MTPSRTRTTFLALGAAAIIATYSVGYLRTTAARRVLLAHPTLRGVFRDGTFSAWGDSPHGRVLATVRITRGRIVSADITTCRMRYPCSMIARLPAQVVERQNSRVDVVSGATQSAEAFSLAIDRALAQAVRP